MVTSITSSPDPSRPSPSHFSLLLNFSFLHTTFSSTAISTTANHIIFRETSSFLRPISKGLLYFIRPHQPLPTESNTDSLPQIVDISDPFSHGLFTPGLPSLYTKNKQCSFFDQLVPKATTTVNDRNSTLELPLNVQYNMHGSISRLANSVSRLSDRTRLLDQRPSLHTVTENPAHQVYRATSMTCVLLYSLIPFYGLTMCRKQ